MDDHSESHLFSFHLAQAIALYHALHSSEWLVISPSSRVLHVIDLFSLKDLGVHVVSTFSKYCAYNNNTVVFSPSEMSVEESKIKVELEVEVENDLEEEIKNGIYGLALKLHRLYQHKKERMLKEKRHNNGGKANEKIISQVIIDIKMEGGSAIEIKEIKREAHAKGSLISIPTCKPTRIGRGKVRTCSTNPRRIKFDWTKSLRSGSNSIVHDHESGKCTLSPIETKEKKIRNGKNEGRTGANKGKTATALLELGWKY